MSTSRPIEAADAPSADGLYAQAVEVTGADRWLFISGQVPLTADGVRPAGFEAQARAAWGNVRAQLAAAGMSLDNLVRITVYLADRAYRLPNRSIRQEVLGDRLVAMTVVIVDIFDEDWLLEIEAVAAA